MAGDFNTWSMDICFAIFLILALWPGYEDLAPLERPKKGFWTFGSLWWPLKNTWRGLAPTNKALRSAMRVHLALALLLALACSIAAKVLPAFDAFMTWKGAALELAILALLLGRASGLWSADRRIRSSERAPARPTESSLSS